jgi:hypothetical protein
MWFVVFTEPVQQWGVSICFSFPYGKYKFNKTSQEEEIEKLLLHM